MNPSFAQFRFLSLALVLASALAGCATLPPPTGEVSAAQQAVTRADQADADQYAPQELGAARRELAAAQAAMAAGEDEDARRLALAAAADADLALARSRAAQTRSEWEQRVDEIARLRQRLQLDAEPRRPVALEQGIPGGDYATRLAALAADPQLGSYANYERLQAQQAVDALAQARSRQRENAEYLARRRVEVAELNARIEASRRDVDQLDRERSELLVEASRRDAEAARAEAERLRVEAQIRAEEAERLRQQAAVDAAAMQDVEAAIDGVADAQAAKLRAAREREAKLAREEAELVAGGKLPPSRWDGRGEVFTLSADAFESGKATLNERGHGNLRTLAAYLAAGPGGAVRIEGVDASGTLAQKRVEAVRDALVAAGAQRQQVRAAVGSAGKSKPRVEIVLSAK
jgi:outer membrane protein OmpA-like peptidoglycan-associated protein